MNSGRAGHDVLDIGPVVGLEDRLDGDQREQQRHRSFRARASVHSEAPAGPHLPVAFSPDRPVDPSGRQHVPAEFWIMLQAARPQRRPSTTAMIT